MSRLALALVSLVAATAPATTALVAQTTEVAPPAVEAPAALPEVAALTQAMRLDDLFAVLRDEGVDYGKKLETDMFPGGGGAAWPEAVSAIYEVAELRRQFDAVLADELGGDPAVLAELVAFYQGDLGQKVVGLEIEARRAFMDDAVEDAARVAADKRRAERDPRHAQLERFIAAGDLLEMNVAGALSGNLAFLTGMNEAGVYGQSMTQDDIMAEVWGQEAQIRDDTSSWLHAYLGLAYQPLSETEMEDYIAFMEGPAGKRVNAALFVAFDRVFRQVSTNLGKAAGVAMLGSDI